MRGIICGAGIAGLSLAWWLDRAGWDVLVIERTLGLRDEGYMIDFLSSGYDVAEFMGLIPRLKEIHYPIPEMIYVDRNGRRVASLDYKLFYQLQKDACSTSCVGTWSGYCSRSCPSRWTCASVSLLIK